jgi:hypothetical protein
MGEVDKTADYHAESKYRHTFARKKGAKGEVKESGKKMKFKNLKYDPSPKKYFTTQEAADITGLNQTTLTLWIRNKIIDDAKISRDANGRRLWSQENIEMVRRIKKEEGWV